MFPASLPSFTAPDPNSTLDADNHTARHALEGSSIVALATKLGIDGSGDTTSHDYKLSGVATGDKAVSKIGSETLTNKTLTSAVLNGAISGTSIKDEDTMSSNSDQHVPTQQSVKAYVDAAIATAVASAKSALFPVGSYYTNETDGTNPATLLGFGTWTAVANRMIIGKGSGSFATAGATGGAETHTLTNAETPVHSLTISHHGDEGGSIIRQFSGTGGTTSQVAYFGSTYRPPAGAAGGGASYQSPTVTWGSGSAHNNMPPFIVAYIWKRTA